LAESPVARLASVDSGQRPHLVPIVFALEGARLFSAIDSKPKTTQALRRLDNIRANPRVAVLADHYDDDWSRLWWVRIDGSARVEHQGPDRERAMGFLAEKYPHYRQDPPTGPVIVVDIDNVTGWSAQDWAP